MVLDMMIQTVLHIFMGMERNGLGFMGVTDVVAIRRRNE
jgi:hypothetical protein